MSYGVTVVIGRSLAKANFGVTTVLGVRFGVAGLALVAVLLVRRRPVMPAPGERLRAFLLGAIGYGFESTLFFMGLERGTAAAVALLFYSYPAVVTLIESAMHRRIPSSRSLLALALAGGGTAVVVVAGGAVTISSAGALIALGSACSFGVYLLVSHAVIERTDSLTLSAWVALGAALSFVVRGVVGNSLEQPGGHWPVMILNGIATASAFTFMFAGLRRIGPSRTSVIMTLEALCAVVLAAIFLGEELRPLQLVGGAGILAATVLIGTSRAPEVVP
ncbi:MAG: DMT family transporter [Actinobacteria bacterium]|nr:DMT family transporter [Actinomycetota bacterium]MBV9256297.1 DMT family transporter [Actinomycetota bacterium]